MAGEGISVAKMSYQPNVIVVLCACKDGIAAESLKGLSKSWGAVCRTKCRTKKSQEVICDIKEIGALFSGLQRCDPLIKPSSPEATCRRRGVIDEAIELTGNQCRVEASGNEAVKVGK